MGANPNIWWLASLSKETKMGTLPEGGPLKAHRPVLMGRKEPIAAAHNLKMNFMYRKSAEIEDTFSTSITHEPITSPEIEFDHFALNWIYP
jgi:hypothetical protein